MSWDAYVDSVIDHGKGNVAKATLIGLDGSMWTPTHAKGINISAAEAVTIGREMSSKNAAYFQTNGILLEGVKYMFLRDLDGDGKIYTGKKGGLGNITMQKTKMAIVIGFTPDGSTVGISNTAVDTVAKYLESVGY